jgi:hypothetical protein
MEYEFNAFEDDVFESVFEPDLLFGNQTSSEITTQNALSLQNAKERVQSLTTDEFLIEAYNAATQLRNTLGDADALVSELSETIRMNILVVSMSCRKNPTEMILSVARAMPLNDQLEFLADSIEMLSSYKRSIESETLDD